MSGVLGEHIEYLTLKGRYGLFESAFDRVIVPGSIVADLGCGVGVLGLQCLKADASKVYGIDSSQAILIAKETMDRAGLSSRYECISASTYNAVLPERVDTLVCDHIGYFGIDYGIVDMVRDAAKRFLKPAGQIIPDRLSLRLAGVSSEAADKSAGAWVNQPVPSEYAWLNAHARNTKYAYNFIDEELCSREAILGEVALGADADEMFSFSAEIKIDRDCLFTGLVGWFSAHLGGDIWMTNSPLDEKGIGRPQAYFPVSDPFEVKSGDIVVAKIRARSDGELLAWSVKPPRSAIQKQSTWVSKILTEDDLSQPSSRSVGLTEQGAVTAHILSLIDGKRAASEIEEQVLQDWPQFLPTPEARTKFVRNVLSRNAAR